MPFYPTTRKLTAVYCNEIVTALGPRVTTSSQSMLYLSTVKTTISSFFSVKNEQ